jgi:2-aminoadipate transaminase
MSDPASADPNLRKVQMMSWSLASRAELSQPSITRTILKLTARPGLISLAGGLPAPESFPIAEVKAAADRVLSRNAVGALQYGPSDGYAPLREWVSADLARHGIPCPAERILITNGSQQGLALSAAVLLEPGAAVAVESPTYLAAITAFRPTGANFLTIANDEEGPRAAEFERVAEAAFLYLVPNFQNPTGRCISAGRRELLATSGLHLYEDNPYGELWYDAEPPPPIASLAPERTIYAGSFSKVLSPGLRVGYLACPEELFDKLLEAKQADDLHTPMLNQRIVYQVVKDGFLDSHLPKVRQRYRQQRDAMAAALTAHLPAECRWQKPAGGMFFWVELPERCNTDELLPKAIEAGVVFVPGSAFLVGEPRRNTLRLSFVTSTAAEIEQGVAILAALIASQ